MAIARRARSLAAPSSTASRSAVSSGGSISASLYNPGWMGYPPSMDRLRLDRRPEAKAFSVETLLQHVKDGKVRVPDFQRPLRWRAAHVLDLFDSVYRGFPVGDLLLFKRAAPAGVLHVGPVEVTASEVPDAFFVVDGQQRITALAAAMLHPSESPRGDIHAVWFDLSKEEFVCAQSVEPEPEWIPLNKVGDSFELLSWLHAWPFREMRKDLVQKAIALGKALREYPIPAYIVEGASDQALRLIFKRVNTSGVRMRESEVFEALFGAGGHRPIESACARIQSETGFGVIAEETFLRCLKVVEGLDLRHSIAEREDHASALPPGAVLRTEKALRRTVQFLVEDAGIVHRKLLPYVLPLVVLPRFFDLYPAPSPRERALLVRWVWRGALSGVHTNSSDAAVQGLNSLMNKDCATTVSALLATVPQQGIAPPLSETPWYGGAAKTLMVALALLALGPRHPETGAPFALDEIKQRLDRKDVGEVFLDVVGKGQGVLARRLLLLDRKLMKRLAWASPEVLASHAVDAGAAEALAAGEGEAFASMRGPALDAWLHAFFTAKLGEGDGDRPAVAALLRGVDEVFSAA